MAALRAITTIFGTRPGFDVQQGTELDVGFGKKLSMHRLCAVD